MKYYDLSKVSSYLMHWNVNNLYVYGQLIQQTLSVGDFELRKDKFTFDKELIQNYDENSDKGYILKVHVNHPKELHELHTDMPFLHKRMKIDKCQKLVCNLYDRETYVIDIRNLKQALDHGLILVKVCRLFEFGKEAWLKPYIDMNTERRTKVKNVFEKDFFKFMNNSVFGKTMENVWKHRDIRLVPTDRKRSRLVAEPIYHTTKWFSENLLVIEMNKPEVKMNKPLYLGLSILDMNKIVIYEYCYDYTKPKYGKKAKLCYMDTDNFIVKI